MKTIKLLAISMLLMSFSCSKEELKQDCDCVTTYYTLPVGQSQYQWYSTGGMNDDELTCDDAMSTPLHTGQSNIFYQVTCD